MGLYDNYKQTNSTLVESFAGSTVPELTKMKEQLDNRYEIAQEKISGLNDMLVEAPILEADKQNWVNINNEAQAKLGELSKRKDLENTVLDVHLYSAKVANKLKGLALQKKTRDEYYATIDKMDLPNDIKDMYKQESDQNYGGLKFDEYGKAVNSYVGGTPTKNVDTPEKIRKALQILISSGDVKSYTQDSKDGMYTIQTTDGVERRTANEVLGAMRSARALDSEWQASDNQAVRAQVFKNTKNVTDEVVQQFLNQDATDAGTQLKQQEIKRLVEQGISLKEAWKTIQTEQATKDQIDAEDRYALGNTYTKTSYTRNEQEGPEAKDKRERDKIDYTQQKQYEYAMKQAKELAKLAATTTATTTEDKDKDINEFRVVGPMAVLNAPAWAPTIKALQEGGIAKEGKNLEDLNISLKNKQAQLQAAQTSGDQRAQTTLSAEISAISSQIKGSANALKMYKTIETQALDEATREQFPNNPSIVNFETVKTKLKPSIIAELPKTTKVVAEDGSTKVLTADQLAESLILGKVNYVVGAQYPGTGLLSGKLKTPTNANRAAKSSTVVEIGGVYYRFPESGFSTGNDPYNNGKIKKLLNPAIEIVEKAKEKSTKNFSIQDKGVTLTPKEREVMNSGEDMMGFVANDGVTPMEKPVGYDPTKTIRGGTMGEMTGLVTVQYRSTDGTILASGYNTTAGTEIQNFIGERMSRSPQKVVSNIGLQWMYQNKEDVTKLFPGNKIDVDDDGKPILYWNGTATIPVMIDITSAGVGSIVDKATGQVIVINGKKMENQPVSTLQQILTVSKFQK